MMVLSHQEMVKTWYALPVVSFYNLDTNYF